MLLAAMIMVVGCQSAPFSSEVILLELDSPSLSSSMKVTPPLVEVYLKLCKGIVDTKASKVTIDPVLNGVDTVMYLVNYPEGGWELLSADKRIPARLMFSKEKNVSLSELENHPGISIIMNDYKEKIGIVRHSDITSNVTGSSTLWENLSYIPPETKSNITWLQIGRELVSSESVDIPHLISTHWDQSTYNMYLPYTTPQKTERCVSGCTVVAAAQVVNYLQPLYNFSTDCLFLECRCNAFIPNGGGSTSYGDFIPNVSTVQTNANYWKYVRGQLGTPLQQKKAISVLMAILGYRLEASYKYLYDADDASYKRSTSASMYKIPEVYETMYGMTCSVLEGSINNGVAVDQIMDGLPVIVQGYEQNGAGHVWIIDGYYLNKQVYDYHYQGFDTTNPSVPLYKTVREIEEYEEYLLVNWGWGATFDSETYFVGTYTWSIEDYVFSTRFGMLYDFVMVD